MSWAAPHWSDKPASLGRTRKDLVLKMSGQSIAILTAAPFVKNIESRSRYRGYGVKIIRAICMQ